ncbi:uncharacterized protein LOC114524639 [Dendronephthya gigantea]|uniref:uncharacterized protein LOC114524639 n=1 Tax=Dendronephthya gigantea TaxID=151771 RepID=UPI00106C6959|nr:uncharacterized protein LOC114524639 [Dendronephthya gigantea]
MAAAFSQESVTFTETSCENIGYAKEFWRAIDGNWDEKSRLFVSGVDHRLHTAAWSDRKTSTARKVNDNRLNPDAEPGFERNRNECNRRLRIEEEEYIQTVLGQKKDQQGLMKKRREERLAKESIRGIIKQTFLEELSIVDADNDDKLNNMENEGLQAMKDIDNFERNIKMTNERRKENH